MLSFEPLSIQMSQTQIDGMVNHYNGRMENSSDLEK